MQLFVTAKLSIPEAKADGFTLLLHQPAIWKWLQQLVRPVAWTLSQIGAACAIMPLMSQHSFQLLSRHKTLP